MQERRCSEPEAFIMAKRVFHVVGAGIAVAAGAATWFVASNARPDPFPRIAGMHLAWPWAVGVGIVVLVAPYLIYGLISWIVKQIRQARFYDLLAAAGGLIVGL